MNKLEDRASECAWKIIEFFKGYAPACPIPPDGGDIHGVIMNELFGFAEEAVARLCISFRGDCDHDRKLLICLKCAERRFEEVKDAQREADAKLVENSNDEWEIYLERNRGVGNLYRLNNTLPPRYGTANE